MNQQTYVRSGVSVGDGTPSFPFNPQMEIWQTYDGLGAVARRTQITREEFFNEEGVLTNIFASGHDLAYLRATPLGGLAVAEVGNLGDKRQINIYANGQRIAREESEAIKYESGNPETGSWVVINGHSDDRFATREERDPLDADLPLTDPDPSVTYTGGSDGQLYIHGGDPFDLSGGCELDGMPISCSDLYKRMEAGFVAEEYLTHDREPRDIKRPPRLKPEPSPRKPPPAPSWKRRTFTITSLGIGLFRRHVPDIIGDEDGGLELVFKETVSSFPQNTYDPRVDFRDYAYQLSTNGQNNDCLKLALLAFKAGQVFADPIHGLLNGLTEVGDAFGGSSDPNYRVGVLTRDTYYGNSFTGSGFLPRFRDPSNQVRHFVGWFAAGAYYPGPVARRMLYSQEGTRNQTDPDVALGLQAINMGIEFSKTKDHRALAQAIWRDVCGGTTPLNLP